MVYCSIFAHFEVRIEALLKFRVYVTGVSRFAKHTVNNKLALSQRLGASLIYSNIFRLLDVALLKAVALLLVYNLQEDRDDDCNSAEESED